MDRHPVAPWGMPPALKPCRACQHQVASGADTCPSCGVRRPAGGVHPWIVALTVLAGLAFIGWAIYRGTHMAG